MKPHAIIAVVFTLLTGVSQAQFVTFGQFTDGGGAPFTFTNTGPGSTLTGTTEDGYFNFLVNGLPSGNIAATITLTSSELTPGATGGPFTGQPIDGLTNTLTITQNSDGANLLTVNFNGEFVGFTDGGSAQLSADNNPGDTLTYSSDFLNFSGTTALSMGLDSSPISSGFVLDENGFPVSYTTDLTGGFSAAGDLELASVPEPSTWAMLLGGLGLLSICLLRKNRKTA
jgi:hypothetical protein